MDHTFEEIRGIVLDILAGRETVQYKPQQYRSLEAGVAEVAMRRNPPAAPKHSIIQNSDSLSPHDAELLMEVFWSLFREGVITLGLDSSNLQFPWFRVSQFGKRLLAGGDAYFFHDVTTYEKLIKEQIPKIDAVTLVYLKEAMQTFRSGCILSCSVMLGVATEHTFLLLMDAIEKSAAHQSLVASIGKEKQILTKVNKFKDKLDGMATTLPSEIKEDLDTHFASILSVIRTFRNESGHPSGKIIDREQAYVLLHLFIPYAKKMYQLMNHFV